MPASQATLKLILSRIKAVDTGYETKCWVWQGALDSSGYAVIKIRQRQQPVHHLIKQPPKGMEIDHLCRTRNCVRPQHLEVVSQEENKRRANAYRFNKK